jgi:hypothetical protein
LFYCKVEGKKRKKQSRKEDDDDVFVAADVHLIVHNLPRTLTGARSAGGGKEYVFGAAGARENERCLDDD